MAELDTDFLGVAVSATGHAWRDRLNARERLIAATIAQRYDLSDILARVLAGRGTGIDDVEDALEPTLRRLMPDPSTLTDMDKAADRLAQAIMAREPVALFGDYDVDGASSCAVLGRLLAAYDVPHHIHIPDRITEGYGPTDAIMNHFVSDGFRLIVLLDCGTMSHQAISRANALGAETIVLDHHQSDAALPPAFALVNPNRQDDLSGLGHLCAAGVTFIAAVAINRCLRQRGFFTENKTEFDLLRLLDIVALATIADVVPLLGLNRALVVRGLEILNRQPQPGLRALIGAGHIDGPVESFHLGFVLGPRINAGGRIGEAGLGCRLLMSNEEEECARIAGELDRLNRERQLIEQQAVAEAVDETSAAIGMGEGPPVVVASAPDWHPGVLGLIAARLKEKFERPAFALAVRQGVATGSGRSIAGVDLGQVVRHAVSDGILLKGGGHAMAAGVTLDASRLADFRGFLVGVLRSAVEQARGTRERHFDAAMSAASATVPFVHELARAGPFGTGRSEPLLAFPAHRLRYADIAGTQHIRATLATGDGSEISAIAFRAVGTPLGDFLLASRGKTIHAAGHLSLNRWQGRERVQLRLVDAARAHI
ncbi:MAG: single-stranded-DNA-specific exonuclease RecJ [Hyphomicrobiales bacterium]|nr:single-stranded-DNA-specific exonuclease RecJ [Hyphomicrobiales bacterium]OQW82377.1 MAG: single-stranded-DNA-specific exonuclease RecJ [Proteobacteria bacterium ST_bin15]